MAEIMAPAWASFVLWAYRQPEARKAFAVDTGIVLSEARSPLDALIDDATGRTESDAFEFAKWVTERHWGMAYAPAEFRAACERTAARS